MRYTVVVRLRHGTTVWRRERRRLRNWSARGHQPAVRTELPEPWGRRATCQRALGRTHGVAFV